MYRKYHAKFQQDVITIFPGEYYVTNRREIISTILGSCISVCLFDSVSGVAGMNHFMLPVYNSVMAEFEEKLNSPSNFYNNELRYGTIAMEKLIGELQQAGANRKYLKAKVFGGGNVLQLATNSLAIGSRNTHFINAYLAFEDIEIVGQDLEKDYGRKIFFMTDQFKVFMKRISITQVKKIERVVDTYHKQIIFENQSGGVDLF